MQKDAKKEVKTKLTEAKTTQNEWKTSKNHHNRTKPNKNQYEIKSDAIRNNEKEWLNEVLTRVRVC